LRHSIPAHTNDAYTYSESDSNGNTAIDSSAEGSPDTAAASDFTALAELSQREKCGYMPNKYLLTTSYRSKPALPNNLAKI